ncbi:MAG TPA: hypothetical protein VF746_29980 [Longimicrobium sp.]
MRKKLSLDLDALAVDTFATTPAEGDARGTVRANDSDEPVPTPPVYEDKCTCAYSCLCKTAYYNCGTGPYTIYSCHYTQNLSCYYTQVCTPPEA